MTCKDAIREVFEDAQSVLTTEEVIARIHERHPDCPWQEGTIRAHLYALSINNEPAKRSHPSTYRYAFLKSLGRRRYQLASGEEISGVGLVGYLDNQEGSDDYEELPESQESVSSSSFSSFSFERDLEDSLSRNLEQLEPGLRLYKDGNVVGRQLDTRPVGRLDLLCLDSSNRVVVIELKAGIASDRVMGQILRYMGWAREFIAEGREVRGVIVANDFDDNLVYAAKAVSSVSLKRYSVQFKFEDA